MKAYDLAIDVENRPGRLADAAEALAAASLSIEGVAGWGEGPTGTLHILVSDPDEALDALDRAGIGVRRVREALLTSVSNRPGMLVRFAQRLADHGINLEAVYIGADSRLVVVCSDIGKARSVWAQITSPR